MIMLCGVRTSHASRVLVTVCSICLMICSGGRPFNPVSRTKSCQRMQHTTRRARNETGCENEVMNLERTGGVKNEMTEQGMCTTFKRTKGGEADSTSCLRYSTPQELFVCLFSERHSFSVEISCAVCVLVCLYFPSFLCVPKQCWFAAEVSEVFYDWSVETPSPMDMETDTMACEKIQNGAREVTKMKTSRNMSTRLLQSRLKRSLRLNVQDSWDSQARLRTS